jgi:hypothetical protein
VLSIKLIYLELLIFHFIRPVESAELPNVARVSKSLETPGVEHVVHFTVNTIIDTDKPLFHTYCMLQPKKAITRYKSSHNFPFFLPHAMPPYTGQCLHIGSMLDWCTVLVLPLILLLYKNIEICYDIILLNY